MRAPLEREPKFSYGSLILVFLILCSAIILSGAIYYARQKRSVISQKTRQLQAIADLKIGEIGNWIAERMGDARLISGNPILNGELISFLREPIAGPRQESIRDWMLSLQAQYHYENVLLLDHQDRVVLSASSHHAEIGNESRKLLELVRARQDATLSKLHENPDVPHIHLDLATPLLAGGDVAGFVLLRIDPGRFLFPLVQSWPTPSPSAETLLVRREGGDVLFLNELRHRANTALNLRIPLSRSDVPAIQAALGRTGVVHGMDYRGVPVWSILRPVSGTGWFMVAKVDEREILAPLRRSALALLLIAISLILAAAGLALFLWQRRDARFRLRQLEAEHRRQALVRHFDFLSRHANDLILLSDGDHDIIEANERAVQAYGYSREELLAMNIRMLRVPGERESLDGHYRQAREHDGIIFETLHRRRDGSSFPVEVSARIIQLEGREYFQSIYRDISERKEAEARLRHANRLYAVLSQVNQAIVRARDRERLFLDICDVAVRFGEFSLAWIGLIDQDTVAIRPAFQAGHATGDLDLPPLPLKAAADGNPTAAAVDGNRLVVWNDIAGTPASAAWHDSALAQGFRSVAVLPLRDQGGCIGGLTLYSGEANFFDPAVIGLLEEITGDIAFALEALDREEKRLRAERALQDNEAFTRVVLDNLPVGIAVNSIDPAVTFNYMNDHFPLIYRTTREKLAQPDAFWEAAYENPAVREEIQRRVLADCASGDPRRMVWNDIPIERQGEATTYVSARNLPLADRGLMISLAWDVSERVRSELALKESEEKFRQVFEAANVGKSLTGIDGRVDVNQALADMLGYSRKEMRDVKWQDLTPAADIELTQRELEPLLKGEKHATRFNKRYLRKDGGIVWGDVSVVIRRDDQGRPLHFITTVVDISERKQAENKLKEQHGLLRIAGEMARLGGWNVNLEENRSYWSDEVAAIHEMPPGYSPLVEEGIGFYAPEWRERITEVFSACAQQGIPYNEEMEIVTAKGKRRWVQTIGEAVRDDKGRIFKVQGAFQDISARKQAERNLQRLSERNQALLDAIPDIIMEVDADKVYTWANHAGIEFFGEDVIGREAAHYFAGEQKTYQLVKPLFNGHDEIIYVESWQRRRDGEKRLLAWWCRVLKDVNSQVTGALSSARDITEIRRGEEALRESERKFRETIATLDEGYYSVTLDGKLLDHNQAFCRILGFDAHDDLRGLQLPDFWRDPGKRKQYIDVFQVNGAISNYQIEARQRDGTPITVLASAHLVKDGEGKPLHIEGVFMDISERIRTEAEIRQMNEELEQRVQQRTAQLMAANKELEAFSYSVSHDLRAPLRAIDGFSRIILEDYAPKLDKEGKRLFDVIAANTHKMGLLIDDLLAFSRLSRQAIQYAGVDLSALARDIFAELRTQEKGRKIEIKIGKHPLAVGDRSMLRQVLHNLLANAVKFTRTRPRAQIEFSGEAGPAENIYRIKDNGVGFDIKYVDKLFGVFQRLHGSDEFEGTGVGLAIVQRIILRHGGRVWAESKGGKGATFFFALPSSEGTGDGVQGTENEPLQGTEKKKQAIKEKKGK